MEEESLWGYVAELATFDLPAQFIDVNFRAGIIPNLYILMAETLMKLIKPDNLDEYVKLGYRVVLQAFNSSSDTPIANVRGWLHILRPWYNVSRILNIHI